jgi:SAM-dependent methyltransferase
VSAPDRRPRARPTGTYGAGIASVHLLFKRYLAAMSDLWQVAHQASERFAAQALDYDRFRPRYPDSVFDDIMELANLVSGAEVIEVGAGTGIATEPLVDRGLVVTAIEPAAEMAGVAETKLGDRAQIFVGRFEDYPSRRSVDLIASFNAWHWIEPALAVDRAAQLIKPGGYVALVWTEVLSWGQEPFEERIAEVFGAPWEKRFDHVGASMHPIRDDARFDEFEVRHHRFERKLDGAAFVAVTKTYGGHRTDEQYQAIERVINREFEGKIEKVEDAGLYLARRH